jgi:acetylornithine deacetylase
MPSRRGQEGPCQEWMAAQFEARGWAVDRYAFSEVELRGLPGFSPVMDADDRAGRQAVAALRAREPKGRSGMKVFAASHDPSTLCEAALAQPL